MERQIQLLQESAQATDCEQGSWHMCILHTCEKHYDKKRYEGFHPDDEGYRKNLESYEKPLNL